MLEIMPMEKLHIYILLTYPPFFCAIFQDIAEQKSQVEKELESVKTSLKNTENKLTKTEEKKKGLEESEKYLKEHLDTLQHVRVCYDWNTCRYTVFTSEERKCFKYIDRTKRTNYEINSIILK